MIITDFGSGNSCRNEWPIAKEMIDALAEIDKDRECIIKWQLFEKAEPNIPLDWAIFDKAYDYALKIGFQTTASVFDLNSLRWLLNFEIPFVKIANRRDLDWLIGEVPRKIPVIRSIGNEDSNWNLNFGDIRNLCCVSRYPASIQDYSIFSGADLKNGISDHTTDWILYRKYQPEIYECHFVLNHDDPGNPDAGPFSRTPEQLREIL